MSLPGRWLATVARCVGRRDTLGVVLGGGHVGSRVLDALVSVCERVDALF